LWKKYAQEAALNRRGFNHVDSSSESEYAEFPEMPVRYIPVKNRIIPGRFWSDTTTVLFDYAITIINTSRHKKTD